MRRGNKQDNRVLEASLSEDWEKYYQIAEVKLRHHDAIVVYQIRYIRTNETVSTHGSALMARRYVRSYMRTIEKLLLT